MKKTIISFIIISLSLFQSCVREGKEINFKDEFIDSVKSYIRNDRLRHNSYIIFPANYFFTENKRYEGLLIGPLYKDISTQDDEKHYIKVMTYNSSSVYYYCPDIKFVSYPFTSEHIQFCKSDSIVLYKQTFTRSPIINYLKRAVLYFYKDNYLYKQNNVDSLFLPRIKDDKN